MPYKLFFYCNMKNTSYRTDATYNTAYSTLLILPTSLDYNSYSTFYSLFFLLDYKPFFFFIKN